MNFPNMTVVKSSNVVALGHIDNTLFVEFRSGTYAYHDVSIAEFTALMEADSIGRHLNKNIKPSKEYEKIS